MHPKSCRWKSQQDNLYSWRFIPRCKTDTDETDTDEIGTDETDTDEIGTDETDTDETDTDETDTDEIGTDETDTDETDTDETDTDEIGTDKSGTDKPEDPKKGLSGGAIAGIIIGIVVVLCGIGFALWWFVFRKKKTAWYNTKVKTFILIFMMKKYK